MDFVRQTLSMRDYKLLTLPVITLCVIALGTLLAAATPGSFVQTKIFDAYMALAPRTEEQSSLSHYAIIDIDRESLANIAPWPWSRTRIADLVTSATNAGAAKIVVALDMSGPDPLSPETIGQTLFYGEDPALHNLSNQVAHLPSSNVILGNSLSQSNSNIGVTHITTAPKKKNVHLKEGGWWSVRNRNNKIMLPYILSSRSVSRELTLAATPIVLGTTPDTDDRVRRALPLFAHTKDTDIIAVKSAALAGAMTQDSMVQLQVVSLPVAAPLPTAYYINNTKINTDPFGSVLFYPPKNKTIPRLPAWRVLMEGTNWTNQLAGKIVYIGETTTSQSIIPTATGPLPRVDFQVLLADQLRNGVSVARYWWLALLEVLVAALTACAAIYIAMATRPSYGMILSGLVTGLAVSISVTLFWVERILIDPTPVILMNALGLFALLVSYMTRSYFGSDRLNTIYHGALAPRVLQSFKSTPARKFLTGTTRQVTVLSAAIRLPEKVLASFTDRPDAYMHFIATANDLMRHIIHKSDGTLDFGENGRLLAYWNAPEEAGDHIRQACNCALKMIDQINDLTQDFHSSNPVRASIALNSTPSTEFEQGCLEVGIASDVGFAGAVGADPHNRYSVIGSCVTYASHLRSRSRYYGPAVIVDETIYNTLRGYFAFLDLDSITVNDEHTPRAVYGLVGNQFLKASPSFRELAAIQRSLVNAWRDQDAAKMSSYLQQYRCATEANESMADLYQKRLENHKNTAMRGWVSITNIDL